MWFSGFRSLAHPFWGFIDMLARIATLGFTATIARIAPLGFEPSIAFFLCRVVPFPKERLNDIRMPHQRPRVGLRYGLTLQRPGNMPEMGKEYLDDLIPGRIVDVPLAPFRMIPLMLRLPLKQKRLIGVVVALPVKLIPDVISGRPALCGPVRQGAGLPFRHYAVNSVPPHVGPPL